MEWVFQTGGTQAVQFTLRFMFGQVYNSIDSWIRRQIIKFRIYTIGFPMHWTRAELYAYSATEPINDYLHSKQPGITVFWAPAYSGKSFTLSHLAYRISSSEHIFIHVDYTAFHAGEDSVMCFLHKRLGLNDHQCALSAFLPRDAAFITVVLDHFEVAMQRSPTDAIHLIQALSDDSRAAQFYNILVVTKKHDYAQTLLRSSLGRLLGPRFCGRWTHWPGGELCVLDSLVCILMAFTRRTSRQRKHRRLRHAHANLLSSIGAAHAARDGSSEQGVGGRGAAAGVL